jgi:hypothetical protein
VGPPFRGSFPLNGNAQDGHLASVSYPPPNHQSPALKKFAAGFFMPALKGQQEERSMHTITLDRPSGAHAFAGLSDKSLTGLCRQMQAAGIPDGPAITHDGTMPCIRLGSIYRYARLQLVEDDAGRLRYRPYAPFKLNGVAQDRLREVAE